MIMQRGQQTVNKQPKDSIESGDKITMDMLSLA